MTYVCISVILLLITVRSWRAQGFCLPGECWAVLGGAWFETWLACTCVFRSDLQLQPRCGLPHVFLVCERAGCTGFELWSHQEGSKICFPGLCFNSGFMLWYSSLLFPCFLTSQFPALVSPSHGPGLCFCPMSMSAQISASPLICRVSFICLFSVVLLSCLLQSALSFCSIQALMENDLSWIKCPPWYMLILETRSHKIHEAKYGAQTTSSSNVRAVRPEGLVYSGSFQRNIEEWCLFPFIHP